MSRRTAHDVLKSAFEAAGLNGHLATHSLRKSFAQRLYDRTSDIFAVQEMLGHKNVSTTQKYLGVNYANVREALEEMSLESELNITGLLGSALKKEKDETLFLELALRGYDLSSLRRRPRKLPKSSNWITAKFKVEKDLRNRLNLGRLNIGFSRKTFSLHPSQASVYLG